MAKARSRTLAARGASSSNSMQNQLTAFVEQPCQATFMAVRSTVLRQSPLPMTAAEIADLERLLANSDFQALLDRLGALPASKILSPRVHYLSAEAAEALGDADGVELERSLFVLVLKGLLATGDGTRANPFVVCHSSDEHDILAALNREAARQSLVDDQDRLLDKIVCTDGRETWFDVTDILARPRPVKRPVRVHLKRRRPISRIPK